MSLPAEPAIEPLHDIRGALPPQRSPLIGRDEEVEQVEALLTSLPAGLVTLTGPGGVGKTRLATAVAHRLWEAYPGGVWFVPLATLNDPAMLLFEIATALGIREGETGGIRDQIVAHFQAGPALVVLDNMEHLLPAASQVADLLRAVQTLTLLATSREPLRLYGEREYPVRPLAVTSVDVGQPSAAEALFLARANEARYGFASDATDRETVREICRQLAGLPLAIELAAMWVKVLSPRQLRQKLDSQLDLLSRGSRDQPERHRTIRATIAWSYELLSSDEQLLFRRLSAFAGPFSLADVAAVMAPPDADLDPLATQVAYDVSAVPIDVVDHLTSLISKNLVVTVLEDETSEQPSYQLLETIRAYGMEQLSEAGEAESVKARLATWYAALAGQWSAGLWGTQRPGCLRQFDREYPNLRLALEWSVASGDSECAFALVEGLHYYWDWRGLLTEARTWAERSLEVAGDDAPAAPKLRTMYTASVLAWAQADYGPARQWAEQAIHLAEAAGDAEGRGLATTALGLVQYEMGDLEGASVSYRRSLEARRTLDDPKALEVSLVNLAWVQYLLGDFDEAEALLSESLETYRSAGIAIESAWSLTGLGLIAYERGNLDQAAALIEQAAQIRKGEDDGLYASTLAHLSAVVRDRGDPHGALRLLQEALALRWPRGEKSAVIETIAGIALVAARLGWQAQAATLFGAVESLRTEIGFALRDYERPRQEEALADLRRTMPSEQFERAWSEGIRMSLGEAVEWATAVQPAEATPAAEGAPSTATIPAQNPLEAVLTRRELEVITLIASGKSDREIADELFISRATASRHVFNILQKLGVNSRAAAAAWAVRNGLLA